MKNRYLITCGVFSEPILVNNIDMFVRHTIEGSINRFRCNIIDLKENCTLEFIAFKKLRKCDRFICDATPKSCHPNSLCYAWIKFQEGDDSKRAIRVKSQIKFSKTFKGPLTFDQLEKIETLRV